VLANASSRSRTLPVSLLQIRRDLGELGESGLEVFDSSDR
jgi:hypothetical protein